jgi:hypothetical protein
MYKSRAGGLQTENTKQLKDVMLLFFVVKGPAADATDAPQS